MQARVRKVTIGWLLTSFLVFLVMIGLGITMRLAQGAELSLGPDKFYAFMTMHGLGMAGSLFSGALAILVHIAAKHVKLSKNLLWVALALFLVGALALLYATLGQGFKAGWYALYPMPFVKGAGGPLESVVTAVIALMLMGVAWLLVQLELLRAMARVFGFKNLLGWQYFRGPAPAQALPVSILIASVCVIAGILGTIVGAATFTLYLMKAATPAAEFDPLLLKNMMLMFGHTIVNVCIYAGVAAIYTYLPRYTGREWGISRLTAIAWNATLVFVLFAYFHHLYMDFNQPKSLHVLGQIISYSSAVPATAVSIFGMGAQVYKSGMKWSFTPLAFIFGAVGWAVGGFAAVIDSTIYVNSYFHNTLWVPAHFHTYFVVGYVLMFFGFLHHFFKSSAERFSVLSLATLLLGGYGFLLMFYLGGMNGVPRRFASYSVAESLGMAHDGTALARIGALFGVIFLLGVLGFGLSIIKGRGKSQASALAEDSG